MRSRDDGLGDGAAGITLDLDLDKARQLLEEQNPLLVEPHPSQDEGRAHVRVTREGHLLGAVEDAHRAVWAESSGGSTNVVSESLNSAASACICAVVSPRASVTTARGLPPKRSRVNTSTVT